MFCLAILNAFSKACSYSSALPIPYEISPFPLPTNIKTLLWFVLFNDVTFVTESESKNRSWKSFGLNISSFPGSKNLSAPELPNFSWAAKNSGLFVIGINLGFFRAIAVFLYISVIYPQYSFKFFLLLNSSIMTIWFFLISGVTWRSLFSCSSYVKSSMLAQPYSFLALKFFRNSLKDSSFYAIFLILWFKDLHSSLLYVFTKF